MGSAQSPGGRYRKTLLCVFLCLGLRLGLWGYRFGSRLGLGAGSLHLRLGRCFSLGGCRGLQLLDHSIEFLLGVPAVGTTGLFDAGVTQTNASARGFDVQCLRDVGNAELEFFVGCGCGGRFGRLVVLGHLTFSVPVG